VSAGGEHRLGPYLEAPAPASLGRWVARVWRHEARSGGPLPTHRVLPVAHPSLAFTYRRSRTGRPEDPELLLVGPVRRPRSYRPGRGAVMEAVQLRAPWMRGLLGVGPADHDGAVRPASEAGIDDDGVLFREAWARVRAGERALPALMTWVGERGEALDPGPGEWLADRAVRRLEAGAPRGVRVSDVAEELGVSPRHLRRAVRELTGRPPKYLQRVFRLDSLLRVLDREGAPRWSRLAAAFGYADQSHLIGEVGRLAGRTPVALHRERRREHVRFLQARRTPPP